MRTKISTALLATGIVSVLAFGSPGLANADARSRQKKLDHATARAHQGAWGELHKDRAELRRDHAELEQDRADLQRLRRRGASRDEIVRKRAEIRQDLGEIVQDRREIRDDYGVLGRNRDRYGSDNSNDRWNGNQGGWNRNDNGWWGRGNDRSTSQGRWGRDFRRD